MLNSKAALSSYDFSTNVDRFVFLQILMDLFGLNNLEYELRAGEELHRLPNTK